MTEENKRLTLRERIEAGEARNAARAVAESAKEAASNGAEFVKKHPLASIGGAVVVGLAIGAMTRPGRRVARKAAVRSSVLGRLARDAVLAYGVKLIDEATSVARTGQDKLEDLGDAAQDTARSAKREIGYAAGKATDSIATARRTAARKSQRAVRGFRDRISS